MLTDIPIGAWTSALMLDSSEGELPRRGRRRADRHRRAGSPSYGGHRFSELADLGTEHERAIALPTPSATSRR